MEKGYIALQCLGNDAGTLFAHIGIASGCRESHGIRYGILGQISGCRYNVINGNTGKNLGEHCLHDIVYHRKVGFLKLLETEVYDFPLALCPGKVCIHLTKPCVRNCLDTVQMVEPRLFQLIGTYSGSLHSLRNIGIDIVKFRLAQLHIHSAQNIDRIHHCFPVKCGKIIYLQVQVSVQRLHCLLRTSQEISLIDLIVQPVLTYTEICVPKHADKLNLAGALVNVAYDDNIGVIAFSHRVIPAVHTKEGNGPVSLHLLYLLLRDIRVSHLGRFKLAWLNQTHLILRIPVKPGSQKE